MSFETLDFTPANEAFRLALRHSLASMGKPRLAVEDAVRAWVRAALPPFITECRRQALRAQAKRKGRPGWRHWPIPRGANTPEPFAPTTTTTEETA